MNGLPNVMMPVAPEVDDQPTPDESLGLVGLARGHREAMHRRLEGEEDVSGMLPDVLLDPIGRA